MQIPMIDTLTASIDIEHYDDIIDTLSEKLAKKKEEAKLAATNQASQKAIIQIGKMNFQVLPNGKMGYAFILHNEFYEVNIAQFRSKNSDFYPLLIRVKSECLWSQGPEKAWNDIIAWVQGSIGDISAEKVSRIDLCVHTDIFTLSYEDAKTLKGNFFNETYYSYRRKVSGMCFGSGNTNGVYCRIYNKSLEVRQKRSKMWFYDIWKRFDSDCKNVWNVEFQICRDFLKEHQIETVADAFSRLKTIWDHCTKEYIIKVSLKRTRVERCSIDNRWLDIQNAFDDFRSESLVKREKQLSADADALIPGIIGNITSFAARKGITDNLLALSMVKAKGDNYFEGRKTEFRKIVKAKMSLMDM